VEQCQRVLSIELVGLNSLKENCKVYHSSPCGGQVNFPSCDPRASC
jgi:hypothetical protein